MMLCFWACRPLMRLLACCSFRMMKGRPYSSKTMDMVAALFVPRKGGLFPARLIRCGDGFSCARSAGAEASTVLNTSTMQRACNERRELAAMRPVALCAVLQKQRKPRF